MKLVTTATRDETRQVDVSTSNQPRTIEEVVNHEGVQLESRIRTTIWPAIVMICACLYFVTGLFNPYSAYWSLSALLMVNVAFYYRRKSVIATAAASSADFTSEKLDVLAALLTFPNSGVKEIARLRLMRLLPTVESKDISQLSPAYKLFNQWLTVTNANCYPTLALILVQMFHRLNITDAGPTVRRLQRKILSRKLAKAVNSCTLSLSEMKNMNQEADLETEQTGEQVETITDETATSEKTHTAVEGATTAVLSPSDEVDQVIRRLAAPDIRSRENSAVGLRITYLAMATLVFVPYGGFLVYDGVVQRTLWLVALGMGLMLSPLALHRMTLGERHMTRILDMAYSPDKSNVGVLIDALMWPDEHAKRTARFGLTRLLPTLNMEDANLITKQQRNILYSCLQPAHASNNIRFVIAILQGLEQIGDQSAIPVVSALCKPRKWRDPASSGAKRYLEVQKAAQHCLKFLEQSVQTQDARQSLLRASQPEQSTGEHLLRSSIKSGATDSAQLLRTTVEQQNPTD
jgi:predicted sugar kinase